MIRLHTHTAKCCSYLHTHTHTCCMVLTWLYSSFFSYIPMMSHSTRVLLHWSLTRSQYPSTAAQPNLSLALYKGDRVSPSISITSTESLNLLQRVSELAKSNSSPVKTSAPLRELYLAGCTNPKLLSLFKLLVASWLQILWAAYHSVIPQRIVCLYRNTNQSSWGIHEWVREDIWILWSNFASCCKW